MIPVKPARQPEHVCGVLKQVTRNNAVQLGACEQLVTLIEEETMLTRLNTASTEPDANAAFFWAWKKAVALKDALLCTLTATVVLAAAKYMSRARAIRVRLFPRLSRPAGRYAVTEEIGPSVRMTSGGMMFEVATV